MRKNLLTIGEAAVMLGVSIQTLRRWDESGKLSAIRKTENGYRYYSEKKIERYIKKNVESFFKLAKKWATSKTENKPFPGFYCKDVSSFQMRLTKLESQLEHLNSIKKNFSLITAITGEIGNNSFDHNLGNWPDIPGIFFSYNTEEREIVLADRGQGILTTLKKVKPELKNHQEALKVAFTENISGRYPEYRGNGLKFVRSIVEKNKIKLKFYTGDARLKIKKQTDSLNIKKSNFFTQGCLALIKF